MSDPAPTGSSLLQRVGGEVETIGVAPVPDEQRTSTPGKLFVVWAMTSASATTPLIASLLFGFGLWYTIGAIVVAWAIFMIPCGLFSEMGRETPLTALVVSRRTYGWSANFLLSILFAFVNMAWFGLNTATGADVLAALAHTSATPWYWVVGGVDILLVLFGFKWLEYFYRYTAIIFVACYGALTVYLFVHYSVHVPGQTEPMQWGPAIADVAGFSILAWTYKVSTISRFSRPAETTRHRTWYVLMPGIGIMVPVLLMGVMGSFSEQATGTWNIALLGAHISGWGEVAAIGAALAVLHTNAMNLYPSTVDLLVTLNTAHKPTKWEQPIATIVLGVLGTLLAQVGILSHAQTFVTDVGSVLGPFAFVMLIDWWWGLKHKHDVNSYFRRPHGFLENWRIPALASFLVGFVFAFWGATFLPYTVSRNFPMDLFGALVAALLYGAWILATRTSTPAGPPAEHVVTVPATATEAGGVPR